MKSLIFILSFAFAAQSAEPTPCVTYIPLNVFLNLPYLEFKSATVVRDSVETYTNGGRRCVGVFIKVPCEL